jgi:selenocysteine lyase/cysteine desulfurase
MDSNNHRDEFPITKNYNFQNHAGVSPLSRRAAEAMRTYIAECVSTSYVGRKWYAHVDHVRQLAADLIGANGDEIAFVKNTTEGLAFLATGLKWMTGDNVITTSVEFPANIYPWMNLQARGVRLKMVIEENGRIPLDRIIEAIDSRTRVVSISAVQFASGFRTDLAALGAACQEKGVILCVDAIQALGVLPIDVQAMHIDVLSADGHKWMCGPEGAGIFYLRKELLGHVKPSIVGWMGMKNATDYGNYQFEFLDDARRFECGSYNVAGLYGLGASLELFLEIGVDRIWSHVRTLTDRLVTGLRDKGYRVISSRQPGEESGIVAFISDVHDHNEVQRHLQAEHRIVLAVREGRLRSSPHLYNTTDEIDQLLDALPRH